MKKVKVPFVVGDIVYIHDCFAPDADPPKCPVCEGLSLVAFTVPGLNAHTRYQRCFTCGGTGHGKLPEAYVRPVISTPLTVVETKYLIYSHSISEEYPEPASRLLLAKFVSAAGVPYSLGNAAYVHTSERKAYAAGLLYAKQRAEIHSSLVVDTDRFYRTEHGDLDPLNSGDVGACCPKLVPYKWEPAKTGQRHLITLPDWTQERAFGAVAVPGALLDPSLVECTDCLGTGKVLPVTRKSRRVTCNRCKGTGTTYAPGGRGDVWKVRLNGPDDTFKVIQNATGTTVTHHSRHSDYCKPYETEKAAIKAAARLNTGL